MALTAKKVYAILKRQISDMEAKLNSPVRYRGTVATADLFPLNPDIGDMYNIESKSIYGEAGMNVAWNGVVWDTMGAPIDMSLYIKSSELADWAKQPQKPDYTAEEVGALPANTKIPSKTSDLQNDSGFLTKIPDNYLSGTDKTLSASGKAADAKATGDKITELSADISNKLNKNQGSENSGKIAGINESGDIVPMFPVSVDYNEETNCLEFGSDQKMELNKGINLDSTLTKTGYAADAGAVGEITNSLKEDISTKITKFYASSQGETHLADSDNGKIMDMMLYGKSEQKQYSGKNLLNYDAWKGVPITRGTAIYENNGITLTATENDCYSEMGKSFPDNAKIKVSEGETLTLSWEESENKEGNIYIFGNGIVSNGVSTDNRKSKKLSYTVPSGVTFITFRFGVTKTGDTISYKNIQIEKGSTATSYEPYTGGIPSPSPDYPQEIKSVANPTVKVCGKNLFDKNNCYDNKWIKDLQGNLGISNGFFTTNHIFVKKGATVVIRKTGTAHRGYFNISKTKFTYTESTNTTFTAIEDCWLMVSCNKAITPIEDFQIELGSTPTAYEPYHEQTVTLPYTLNAIPVNSGGNVTIDGQQYIADYVDVERGKLVRMVGEFVQNNQEWRIEKIALSYSVFSAKTPINNIQQNDDILNYCSNYFKCIATNKRYSENTLFINSGYFLIATMPSGTIIDDFLALVKGKLKVFYALANPTEIDLTPEEIAAFKSLATYYPVTNIFINSEQLDGYTVFNYPISMENGWNYVKQQIGDTRDYIYDMDIQSAEAYVNSEYAVALTELEV